MPTDGSSGSRMQKFGSARLAAGRRPPSVRLSKCFCGRLQIVPKAPSVEKSEHSARRGPPNSRGTVVHGFPFFEPRFRELVFLSPGSAVCQESEMPTNGSPGSGMQVHPAAVRRLPSVRIVKCFCRRLRIAILVPTVKESTAGSQ